MKKSFLLGVTLLAAFTLTGCEYIEGLLQGGQDLLNEKKQFKYDDFVVEIADDDFSFDYTKCTATIENDGIKSVIEYTYDAENSKWVHEEEDKKSYETFDVVTYTKNCQVSAALIGEKVDNVYKFYTSKNGYSITYSYKSTEVQVEGEFNYNKQGLVTSSNEKQTNLKSVEAKTKKATYSYSK